MTLSEFNKLIFSSATKGITTREDAAIALRYAYVEEDNGDYVLSDDEVEELFGKLLDIKYADSGLEAL